jgi:hypothetical protein
MSECQSSRGIASTILCWNNSKTIITQTKQIIKHSASTVCTNSTCFCKRIIGDESINYGQLYGTCELGNHAFCWNNKDGACHYTDKSMCQIEYPNPHHPLSAGTINRKDMLWMNAFTLMIHCAKE